MNATVFAAVGIKSEHGISQAKLARLEDYFRITTEQLPIGIAHIDAALRITRLNDALCTMLGYDADELIGRGFNELTHPHDILGSAVALQRMQKGSVPAYAIEKRYIKKDGASLWVRVNVATLNTSEGDFEGSAVIVEDIHERKSAEAEIQRVHSELLKASRQAGMAEVANNVLHNVGNVLNSVNVSACQLAANIRAAKVDALGRCVTLLQENSHRLAQFLTDDARGRNIPAFLQQLTDYMQENQRSSLDELACLTQNIEHIKHIVTAQQSFAGQHGVTETLEVAALVEDSLAMNRGAFERHGIMLVRRFDDVPPITVDRHKVLQILINLERNAKDACDAARRRDKVVTVSIVRCALGVQIRVMDNGIGIRAEHANRLFTHGFTTKRDGHGFGLHGGALAAKELGGSLEASSAGLGQGATFVLSLPLEPSRSAP